MHHKDVNGCLEVMVMEMEPQQKARTFIEVPRPKGETIRMPMGLHLQNRGRQQVNALQGPTCGKRFWSTLWEGNPTRKTSLTSKGHNASEHQCRVVW